MALKEILSDVSCIRNSFLHRWLGKTDSSCRLTIENYLISLLLLASRTAGSNNGCRLGGVVLEWLQVPVTFTRKGSVCITLKEVVGHGESTVTVHIVLQEKFVQQHKTFPTTTEIFMDERFVG